MDANIYKSQILIYYKRNKEILIQLKFHQKNCIQNCTLMKLERTWDKNLWHSPPQINKISTQRKKTLRKKERKKERVREKEREKERKKERFCITSMQLANWTKWWRQKSVFITPVPLPHAPVVAPANQHCTHSGYPGK